ncbi:GNAT superfamily N-acetyltransferase [Paenibacillus phyllosphaerae]|uniref:GNAT superfamily N-acetyltransferase n=1 Tax=Paenibacillus phyllosphaerae TaxID=274593 RepID=A0A7W5FM52_9BACL|nr:GNAT family N-acetyltransferase [Paenibacillus phyllosphaerae]MBB3109753.1 GNAT superfamily N-acetyltransferase [Paenibacillus phyllosphaerae]
MEIKIIPLQTLPQTAIWREVFNKHGINRHIEYYAQCLEENRSGIRTTIFAEVDREIAGCVHLLQHSSYPHFAEQAIPEINDLNVLPAYRRNGVASALLDHMEQLAYQNGDVIGLGVGLYEDYGAAQRLYCKRGYVPDGKGVYYRNEKVAPGASVAVDDELILYFTKTLKAN